MAATKLGTFMIGLAQEPASMAAFQANPTAAMSKAGLSESDQQAVLSKNSALVSKAVGFKGGVTAADADTVVVVVVL